jgi:hypothetical protein
LLAPVLLLSASCLPEPIPAEELALLIETDAFEVDVGTPFHLTVTRSWSKQLEPEEWSDETLSPLVVRLVDVQRRELDDFVQETRRFRAVATALGDVRVLPPLFVAQPRDGGDEVVITGEELELRARAVLPSGDDSPVELPDGMLPQRHPWTAWLAGLAAAAGLAIVAARRRRREPDVEPVEPVGAPPDPAHVPALRGLDAASSLVADADPRPLHDAVSDVLRDYTTARFGVGAPERTDVELLREIRGASVPQRELLADLLSRCVMVRFAGVPAADEERVALLEDARHFVEATAGEAVG